MKLKFAGLLLLVFMVLFSCQKKGSIGYDEVYGSWNWIESDGGESFHILTPLSEGINITIVYNQNGLFEKYIDNEKVTSLNYYFEKGTSISTYNQTTLITYKNRINTKHRTRELVSNSYKVSGDTLFLYDECFDCFRSIYLKRK